MFALGIVVGVILVFLAVLLLLPIELSVDTTAGRFLVRWRGIGGARLTGTVDDPVLRWWVLGWGKEKRLVELWDASSRKKGKEKPAQSRRSARSKRPRWLTRRLIMGVMRTFRVRIFRLMLDTDDYVLNAFLFPFFNRLSRGSRQLIINFNGRNELVLSVTNRLWDVLWAVIFELIKLKKHRS